MKKHWFGIVVVLFTVGMIVLSIFAGKEEGNKKEYIRDNIKVGLEFKGNKLASMTEQNIEWTKYKISYGLFVKAVYFTVKNDTIVSVWTGYGLP